MFCLQEEIWVISNYCIRVGIVRELLTDLVVDNIVIPKKFDYKICLVDRKGEIPNHWLCVNEGVGAYKIDQISMVKLEILRRIQLLTEELKQLE